METSTTFVKCKEIRNLIVRRTMEGFVYKKSWGKDFRLNQIDEIPEILKKWDQKDPGYFSIQPSELTKDELVELGFGKWSEESPMYLIPIWLYPFLPEEITVSCIDGKTETLKKSEIDTDCRMGLLAYGVYPKITNPQDIKTAASLVKI